MSFPGCSADADSSIMKSMSKPRIVFLDAGTVDWKDQDFAPLKKIGQLKIHYATLPSETLRRVSGFDHVALNKVIFDLKVLKLLKGVKALHLAATGFNNIDLDAAREF